MGMSNTYWNIEDGNGTDLSQGIQSETVARKAAQRIANERGKSVYLYESGSGISGGEGDADTTVDAEEIAPE